MVKASSRQLEGLPAAAFGQRRLAQRQQTALHEAARAQALHEHPGLLELLLEALPTAQRGGRKDRGHTGVEFGPETADPARCFSRAQRLIKHRFWGGEVQTRMSNLTAVRDLDATEAMLGGYLHAALQVSMGRDIRPRTYSASPRPPSA